MSSSSPAHDNDGNLTSASGVRYQWDAENRLIAVALGSGSNKKTWKMDKEWLFESADPEWVKQEDEPAQDQSEEVTKEEAFNLLKDPATDELSRIGLFGALRKKKYDEDAAEFGHLMMELAEKDASPVVRVEAIQLLKIIAWPGSAEYLRGLVEAGPTVALEDDSFDALNHQSRRHHALDALVRLQGANGLRPLLEELHRNENEYARVREKAGSFLKDTLKNESLAF